jgi:two-component system alkaline phosphatase synthesis response regulator PhoP
MGGMTIRRIAVLEDDADIRELIGLYLQRESMEPVLFESPVKFLSWLDVQKTPPDLLVLDLMMPELSGSDVIKSVRRIPACDNMPIVVCSAKSTESDVILTLGLGADAYIRKPFSPRELVAQVGAMLRRSQTRSTSAPQPVLNVGTVSVDTARKSVSVGGRPVDLTPAEFCILSTLVQHKGTVVAREDLLRATGETDAVERVVDVHITSIRHKLGEASRLVRTSRGFGYYVDEEES